MKKQKSYLFKNMLLKKGDESTQAVFSSRGELEVGPAPEFEGSPETLNPEEMFIAAINNCLMTTCFYFVRKLNVHISLYHSEAKGYVEKQADAFRFTNVQARGKVTSRQPDIADRVPELANLAEKYSLVSRSVACPVQYSSVVQVK